MNLENIILMKYGYHAKEDENTIIKRKQQEIMEKGYCFWGYGGTLLNPLKQVQPFSKNKKIYVLFVHTKSTYQNDGKLSLYYSINQKEYEPIPKKINVYGSKYALVFKDLKKVDFSINLNDYEIAIGPSKGKKLSQYFQGRVDKACAKFKEKTDIEKNICIDYIAELLLIDDE